MVKKISAIEKVASFPQPSFSPLTGEVFRKLFEEDRAAALQSEDAANTFLELATDVEALLMISEVSLQAPLNDEGYRLMMHLSHKVFTRAGILNIPDFVQTTETLDRYYLDKLIRFKRDIRAKQSKLTNQQGETPCRTLTPHTKLRKLLPTTGVRATSMRKVILSGIAPMKPLAGRADAPSGLCRKLRRLPNRSTARATSLPDHEPPPGHP